MWETEDTAMVFTQRKAKGWCASLACWSRLAAGIANAGLRKMWLSAVGAHWALKQAQEFAVFTHADSYLSARWN